MRPRTQGPAAARTRPHRACGASLRPGLSLACLGLCWALCTASAAGAPAADPEAGPLPPVQARAADRSAAPGPAQDAQTLRRGGLVVAALPPPVAKAAAPGPPPRARSYLVRALALAIGAGVAWLLNRLGRSADPPPPDKPAGRDAHD